MFIEMPMDEVPPRRNDAMEAGLPRGRIVHFMHGREARNELRYIVGIDILENRFVGDRFRLLVDICIGHGGRPAKGRLQHGQSEWPCRHELHRHW